MEDFDLSDLTNIVTLLFTIASPVLTLVGIAFILGGYKKRFEQLEINVKNLVKNLLNFNNKLDFEVGDIQKEVGEVRNDIFNVREDVSRIEGFLIDKGYYRPKYSVRNSPIKLNDEGEELLAKSEADKYINDNLEELINEISDEDPKSPYDVQELSSEVLRNKRDSDDFIKFKDYAYENGIEVDAIIYVMSIYLRDLANEVLGFIK